MNAKEKLVSILNENKKLKEELKMAKLKETNDADVDTQAPVSSDNKPSDGTPLEADKTSQDDLAKKYEETNEADVDTQAPVTSDNKASDGSKDMVKDASETSQDDLSDKYPTDASKMETADADADKPDEKKEESVDEEADKKEEQLDEEEPEATDMESFREDMGKMVEIVESLKNRVEALEKSLGDKGEDEVEKELPSEDPEPPRTESSQLRDVFVETVTHKTDDNFAKVVKNVIY